MITASYIYNGKTIHSQVDEDIDDFPKKNNTIEIDGTSYFITNFSFLGQYIIYNLTL